jgi:hypothetical protein
MKMEKVTINVPFTAHLETDKNCFSYVEHPLVSVSAYESAGKAKRTFKARLIAEVEEALLAKKNTEARAIGLDNGDVFIVRYGIGGWSYSIVGAGRKHGGCCLIGDNTFRAAYDAAKRHAEQQGTIVYDCSL